MICGTWRTIGTAGAPETDRTFQQYHRCSTVCIEPQYEEIEEIDEDAVSEVGDDDDKSGNEVDFKLKDSKDELDCFIDKDESTEPLKNDNPDISRRLKHDSDTSITESLFTIPDGSAPSSPLDFVVPHILAKELNTPTNALLRRRSERRAGYRIIHDCCPVIMEVKSFPKRRLKPARFNGEVLPRLTDAGQDLGFQCYHLYKKYEHALRTLVVAASGDYWTHRIVPRTETPRGMGDEMDSSTPQNPGDNRLLTDEASTALAIVKALYKPVRLI